MGFEFLRQYNAKRYVNDATAYRETLDELTQELAEENKKQSELLFLVAQLSTKPNFYQNQFKGCDICEMAKEAGQKLVRSTLKIQKLELSISRINENLELKLVTNKK